MFKKILLLQLLLITIALGVGAQVISPSSSIGSQSQLSNMKVDNLSDDQIRQLVSEMKKNNVAYSQIDD